MVLSNQAFCVNLNDRYDHSFSLFNTSIPTSVGYLMVIGLSPLRSLKVLLSVNFKVSWD